MNTCDTCKHWRWWNEECGEAEGSRKRPCLHPKMPQGDDEHFHDEDSTVVFKSIDSYFAAGPKFGCVHHEPK